MPRPVLGAVRMGTAVSLAGPGWGHRLGDGTCPGPAGASVTVHGPRHARAVGGHLSCKPGPPPPGLTWFRAISNQDSGPVSGSGGWQACSPGPAPARSCPPAGTAPCGRVVAHRHRRVRAQPRATHPGAQLLAAMLAGGLSSPRLSGEQARAGARSCLQSPGAGVAHGGMPQSM